MEVPWGALITIFIFMLTHLIGSIWWASQITTTLDFMKESVDIMTKAIIKHESTYYSKEEAAKDFAYRDKEIEAIWRKLDTIPSGNGHVI